jgi:hypothetical protein
VGYVLAITYSGFAILDGFAPCGVVLHTLGHFFGASVIGFLILKFSGC